VSVKDTSDHMFYDWQIGYNFPPW